MKLLYTIISAFICFSCNNTTENSSEKVRSNKSPDSSAIVKAKTDSSTWEDEFTKFSKAVINGDKGAVKSFINFPIKNEGNEIWFLADSKLVMEMNPENIKPFTETDFDKYYNSIFSKDFKQTLEKLNAEQLFKTHNSTSPEIEVVKDVKSTMNASYDKTTNKLTLVVNNDGGDFETSVLYQFDITPDQQLKFRQVRVAG